MSKEKSETHEIILAWLKDEFPQANWTEAAHTWHYSQSKDVQEWLAGTIGGITLEIGIHPKDCIVAIWTKTPFKKASKVREVQLTDPTSIDSLQEVVRHTIKFTNNPFLPPR